MTNRSTPTNPGSGSNATTPVRNQVQQCPLANIAFTVVIIEIKGLYKPGVDDRAVRPAGTTKNSGYVAGYKSDDDRGRIFTNRDMNNNWSKNNQCIEITARVTWTPSACALPAGTKIRWTKEDPDDPTNEDPRVHPDVGRLIDPNDYTGTTKTGANPNDNNPRGKATATEQLEQIDAQYALTGNETVVNPANSLSKVRFKVSDAAGDNYRITAEAVHPNVTTSTPDQTGIMTVWDRIEIEYVKMSSATELPVTQIAQHYEIACVQVDISEKRVVTGASDMAYMGTTDLLARNECVNFCRSPSSSGKFKHEGQGGWFFMVAANRFKPARTANILYEGNAVSQGSRVRLPTGTTLSEPPKVVRVFNSSRIVGMSAPKPNDYDLHIKFKVDSRTGRDLNIEPHSFYHVQNPNTSFLDAYLSDYGFANGSSIPVQVLSEGDEALVFGGISPGGATVGSRYYFAGKLIVFTQIVTGPRMLAVLCHELCHAFGNAHKCGNWDWENKPTRTSCCMNYWYQFVLDNSTPRRPIQWTQNRRSANLCGHHIINIRDFHLEDNPILNWP